MAMTSVGSSTMHSKVWSRLGSAQMAHCAPWEMKAQVSQKATPSLSSASDRDSRSTDALGVRRRWKASRLALLGPTPGSRSSSSMSAVRAGGRNSTPGASDQAPRCVEQTGEMPANPGGWTLNEAWRQPQSRGQLAQLAGGQLAGAIEGFVDSGEDEVLQQLDVLRIDRVGVDLDREDLLVAVGDGCDDPSPGGANHLLLAELILDSRHLGLHLLQLPHHVRVPGHRPDCTLAPLEPRGSLSRRRYPGCGHPPPWRQGSPGRPGPAPPLPSPDDRPRSQPRWCRCCRWMAAPGERWCRRRPGEQP